MNIICTGNTGKNDFYKYLENVIKYIDSKNAHSVYIDEYVFDFKKHPNAQHEHLNKSTIHFDLVISIGGDGALLSAVRRMKNEQIPILGIHIGTLGFLNTAGKDNYLETIDYILSSGSIESIDKPLISVKFLNQNNKNTELLALNEIYINQSYVSRVLTLKVAIDKVELNTYRCDGLIISTPTGSTAYSLSAGGPIVNLNVNGYIITPVSPVSLSSRSIVINDSSSIDIDCEHHLNEITIFADGQESDVLLNDAKIHILKSKILAKIIKTPFDIPYFARLRTQLGWNK